MSDVKQCFVNMTMLCELACPHNTVDVIADLIAQVYYISDCIVRFKNLSLSNVGGFPPFLLICLLYILGGIDFFFGPPTIETVFGEISDIFSLEYLAVVEALCRFVLLC